MSFLNGLMNLNVLFTFFSFSFLKKCIPEKVDGFSLLIFGTNNVVAFEYPLKQFTNMVSIIIFLRR